MPPALRPPQLPPRSPRYPIKMEELEAPASPPLPHDAVPKDGDDFVSGPSEDFVTGDHLTSKHRHSADATQKHLETPSLGTNGSANKLNIFWRGNTSKVASTDVASVGNASDTPIPQGAGTLTGRALHEHAKVALNREEYGTALQSFEALLEAQIQRFGPCHASVAAAMHNVGKMDHVEKCDRDGSELPSSVNCGNISTSPLILFYFCLSFPNIYRSLSAADGSICLGRKSLGRGGAHPKTNTRT